MRSAQCRSVSEGGSFRLLKSRIEPSRVRNGSIASPEYPAIVTRSGQPNCRRRRSAMNKGAVQCSGLRDFPKLLFQSVRKSHTNEVCAREQIVFPRFIDDPDHAVLAAKFVFENWIEFS